MSNFPVYLSFKETNKHFKSLKDIDKQIDYYRYIISVYEEMYSHKSIMDIEVYIDKYKLKNKLKNLKDEYPIESSDKIFANEQRNETYFNTKYYNLHNKLNLLWTSYTNDLDRLLYYHSIIKGDFKLIFTDDDFEKVFNSFQNKTDQLKWINELSQKTYGIYKHFSDRYMSLLYKKYNLLKHFPLTEISEPVHKRSFITKKYNVFRKYLIGPLSHKLSVLENDLEIDIKVDLVQSYKSLDDVSEEDKFFFIGSKYETMHKFAERAFNHLEHKIEYYSYAVSQFYIQHSDLANDKYMQSQLRKIENRLMYLKTKYDMRRNSIIQTEIKEKIILDDEHKIDIKSPVLSKNLKHPILNSQKPIWLRSKSKLLVLLENLQVKGFIEDITDNQNWQEQYLALFIDSLKKDFSKIDLYQPVIWKSYTSDFIYLIKSLNPRNMLPHIHKHHYLKKLSNVFLQSNSEPLNNVSLSSYKNKLKEVLNRELIDEIVNEVRKSS
jgi:hypothetical protein